MKEHSFAGYPPLVDLFDVLDERLRQLGHDAKEQKAAIRSYLSALIITPAKYTTM